MPSLLGSGNNPYNENNHVQRPDPREEGNPTGSPHPHLPLEGLRIWNYREEPPAQAAVPLLLISSS